MTRRFATAALMIAALLAGSATPASAAGDVYGGDPFRTAVGSRCVVGFTVSDGFLTTRRCVSRIGDPVYTPGGERMGAVAALGPASADYAFVRLDAGWTPVGAVRAGATIIPVAGAASAPVGATVCRYGHTTGLRCGTVQAKNVTVAYAGGVVYGLTRTSACAEPGDWGGPFLAGQQAQGLTSGGSGNCATGGVTYFQPVTPALAALGLTLLTSARASVRP